MRIQNRFRVLGFGENGLDFNRGNLLERILDYIRMYFVGDEHTLARKLFLAM